jgi:hypothetical protein
MEDFMATVYQYFDKDTFEPEKNYFSTEKVKYSRIETDEEVRLGDLSYKWTCIGWNSIGWGCLIGFISAIAFGMTGGLTQQPLWYIGTVIGIALFVGGIIFANAVCWPREHKYAEQHREYRKEHEEELWMYTTEDLKAYNDEQKKIAEAWRAEHPLEEKIRACIKDPMSSVDIANLARYYAEEYIKDGVSHETVAR